MDDEGPFVGQVSWVCPLCDFGWVFKFSMPEVCDEELDRWDPWLVPFMEVHIQGHEQEVVAEMQKVLGD